MWYMYYPDIKDVQNLPFYTYSIGLHYWQWPVERLEGYPHPQFLYSWQGSGKLITEGKEMDIPEKTIVFLPANRPHKYVPLTEIWDVRWFVPEGDGVSSLLERFGFVDAKIFPIKNLSALDEIHGKIHMHFQLNTRESIFFSASYTYEFLFEFYKQSQIVYEDKINVHYRKRLTPVLEYIERHLNEPITQKQLCDLIQVSSQHLCRMFHECLNVRPMEYVSKIRIQYAISLLLNTEESIEKIALAVGFNNVNYFCKKFKKYYSMTPGQYRIHYKTLP